MKTLKQWHDSKMHFDKFAQIGDVVSEDIVDYFLNVLPPRTNRRDCVQCGEPVDTVNGRDTYVTFICTSGQWTYEGDQHKK